MTIVWGINANNNYPASPLATTQPALAAGTLDQEFTGLELYNNNEIELIFVGKNRTPLLSTVLAIGRGKDGGEFGKIGLTEKIVTNFPDVKYKEEDDKQVAYTVVTGGNSGATTLVVASTTGLFEGVMLRNVTTNENLRVSSITSATNFVVQRAVGTVTAATVSTDDVLVVIGTSVSKGIARVGTYGTVAVDKFNYFQKFVTTVEIDDFDMMTNKVQSLNEADRLMKMRAIDHYTEQEYAAIFGQKKAGTDANGKEYYTMEGVFQSAKRGWTDDISSALTRDTLEETLAQPLLYTKGGNTSKIALCGTKAKSKISQVFEGRLQVSSIESVNLKFNSMEIDTGDYTFINHPMLNAESGLEGHIIVIDPAYMTVCYPSGKNMQGGFNGKTTFAYDQSASNRTHQEGSYYTYMSLIMASINSGGCFKIAA